MVCILSDQTLPVRANTQVKLWNMTLTKAMAASISEEHVNLLFQPQVLMNNPGAYFVVPDMFAAQMHASCQVNGAQQVQAGHYATSLSNLIGNQVVSNGFTGNHQVQQQVAHPGPTYMQQPQQQMQPMGPGMYNRSGSGHSGS